MRTPTKKSRKFDILTFLFGGGSVFAAVGVIGGLWVDIKQLPDKPPDTLTKTGRCSHINTLIRSDRPYKEYGTEKEKILDNDLLKAHILCITTSSKKGEAND